MMALFTLFFLLWMQFVYGFPEGGLQGESKPCGGGHLNTFILQFTTIQLRIVIHLDKIKISFRLQTP